MRFKATWQWPLSSPESPRILKLLREPTAGQKIVGSRNEDGQWPIQTMVKRLSMRKSKAICDFRCFPLCIVGVQDIKQKARGLTETGYQT